MVSSVEQQVAERVAGSRRRNVSRWMGTRGRPPPAPGRPGTASGRRGRGSDRRGSPTERVHEALDQTAVQGADQLAGGSSARSRNGQWAKATVARSGSSRVAGSKPRRACSTSRPSRQLGAGGPLGGVGAALVAAGVGEVVGGQATASAAASSSVRARVGHGEGSRPSDGASGRASQRCWGRPTVPRVVGVDASSRPTSRMRSRWGRTVLTCRSEGVGDLGGGQGQRASGPARGRWRSGCCRPGPSARRGAASGRPGRARRRLTGDLLPRITEVRMAFVRRTFHDAEFTRARR